ncbi:MAG: proline dehydrogenase family protein [Nitriliruptorales bacterium]
MLRRALIAASGSDALRRVASDLPPARRVVARFVAGETLDDAIAATRELNAAGMPVTLDELGESVSDHGVARSAAASYIAALERLADERLDGSISVKLTQLGLDISEEICHDLLSDVCDRAAALGRHVTIDMEGSDHTAATVALVLRLRAEGHSNVGCAVQSYLHRTPSDVDELAGAGASLRLCKGAYLEPETIAFEEKEEIDAAYAALADRLLGSGTHPRFATHDHVLIHHVKNEARRRGIGPDDFEFQMLFGVREPLQRELVADGLALRIYVPYGREWYPYFMRRLAERPANLAFFLRALASRR